MDLSNCYLDKLGESEAAKLKELRALLPAIVAKSRELSSEAAAIPSGDQTLWGVKIEEQSDASDIVLLKFLRAEELNVAKASDRITQTLVFRADCKIDEISKADLPAQFLGNDFITGLDPEGRPVMISRFGNMDIDAVFSDLEAFVRYRAKIMENAIALLKFEKGSAEDLCQVHDYSGVMSSMYKTEVKQGVSAISKVFSEHYPEFKGKTIFVNFPAVFSKPFQVFAALLPERTRKKFVILGQEDHAALFEMVPPELVPEALGGLFSEPKSKIRSQGRVVLPRARESLDVTAIELPGPSKLLWELRVCTMEVSYEVFFVPANGTEEQVVAKSEPGKPLKAEDGIISGEWSAPSAGTLNFRFRNDAAWFKRRVCVCRADVAE
mmetsp:Transcript_87214/g.182526  ORF Transcript_87214/g.182526 Transcript_87214/m.182526 type:complete len:381 (+) Transcript_87214:128-1270(+)